MQREQLQALQTITYLERQIFRDFLWWSLLGLVNFLSRSIKLHKLQDNALN